MELDGRLLNIAIGCVFSIEEWESEFTFYDDLTGEPLDFENVLQARQGELKEFRRHRVYNKGMSGSHRKAANRCEIGRCK